MKRHPRFTQPLFLGIALTAAVSSLRGDDGIDLTVAPDSSGNLTVTYVWMTQSGSYYFIEQSNDLLEPWFYFPYATVGTDATRGIGLKTTADKMFFRLEHTSDPNSTLLMTDFDGDRVSNRDELDSSLDPFSDGDDDDDGLADDWEVFWFSGTDATADGDADGDGATNLFEFFSACNPDDNQDVPIPDQNDQVKLRVFTTLR